MIPEKTVEKWWRSEVSYHFQWWLVTTSHSQDINIQSGQSLLFSANTHFVIRDFGGEVMTSSWCTMEMEEKKKSSSQKNRFLNASQHLNRMWLWVCCSNFIGKCVTCEKQRVDITSLLFLLFLLNREVWVDEVGCSPQPIMDLTC